MKRLNPNTGKPFRRGDQREDGLYFLGYTSAYIKKNGFYAEQWGAYEKIEKAKAVSREYLRERDYHRQYREKNADKEHARGRAKYYRDREALLVQARTRYAAFKSEINIGKRVTARARSVERERGLYPMPAWLDEAQLAQIKQVYASADYLRQVTGEWYVVDHIIPLGSDEVCGLHVPWNLQIMTRGDNSSKGVNFRE